MNRVNPSDLYTVLRNRLDAETGKGEVPKQSFWKRLKRKTAMKWFLMAVLMMGLTGWSGVAMAEEGDGFFTLQSYDLSTPTWKVGLGDDGTAMKATGLYEVGRFSSGARTIGKLSMGAGMQQDLADGDPDLTLDGGFCPGTGTLVCFVASTKPFDHWGIFGGAVMDAGMLWNMAAGAGRTMTGKGNGP